MDPIPDDLTDFEIRMLRAVHSYRNTARYIAVMVTIIFILTIFERFA